MCEKDTECILAYEFYRDNGKWLKHDFNQTPLKQMTQKCSKSNNGNRGYPDAYYLDQDIKILYIFECKSKSIEAACHDLMKYYWYMKIPQDITVYYIAYVGTDLTNRSFMIFD